MAESKSTQERPAPQPVSTQSGSNSPAAESSDPAVHQLLAELETARQNGNDEGVKAAERALSELGYTAK